MHHVPQNEVQIENATGAFYLPHHPVIKNDSLTTKLRVIFYGSAKSTSGSSLLMGGPSVQDLFSIVFRFRSHTIVLTADITKIYSQVLVDKVDCSLQRIIWRFDPAEELQTYELNTVIYDTASASFLATRALKQLANEEGKEYPLGANVISNVASYR